MRWILHVGCLAMSLAMPLMAGQAESAWQALQQPGHAALMRHARAPGTGDPARFELGDCSTQRNLDARGRDQARRLGELFRAHGISERTVYTSPWCRCSETAELLGIGAVEPLKGLSSFFGDHYAEDDIMPALRRFLRTRDLDPAPVLVTHQVNITALTGVFPSEGEIVVINVSDDGAVEVKGRISPP